MKTIWKFQLVMNQVFVEVPEGAEILSVQVQRGNPCLWALVDPSRPTARRRIDIYGTGHPVPDDPGRFIGTFQLEGGDLIFHVFEPAS